MNSHSVLTGGFTRSTHSDRCLALQAGLMHRPTPSYIQAIGSTLHVVGVCVNRIGTQSSSFLAFRLSEKLNQPRTFPTLAPCQP